MSGGNKKQVLLQTCQLLKNLSSIVFQLGQIYKILIKLSGLNFSIGWCPHQTKLMLGEKTKH
jgi:hypothetical protein